jgi:hypothetical protein
MFRKRRPQFSARRFMSRISYVWLFSAVAVAAAVASVAGLVAALVLLPVPAGAAKK